MQFVVALAAEDAAGVQALRLLAGPEIRLIAVFTGSGAQGPGATVAGLAKKLGAPLRPAGEVRDPALGELLRAQGTDLLLNVHSLHIVHPDVLEAPTLGSFNLHPGPLPGYAGLNAPSWALYEGAETYGATLHRMTAAIDEGPIAFSDSFPVGPDDTALTVLTQCVRRGLPLVDRLLTVAARGEEIPAHAQDLTKRRWYGSGPPEGGRLGWDRPARRVVDFVRACDYGPFRSPWGFPRCAASECEVRIAAAEAIPGSVDAPPGTVIHKHGAGVLIAAADGWVRVESVEVAGRRADAAQVLRPGERLGPAREADATAERGSAQ